MTRRCQRQRFKYDDDDQNTVIVIKDLNVLEAMIERVTRRLSGLLVRMSQ